VLLDPAVLFLISLSAH